MATWHRKDGAGGKSYLPTGRAAKSAGGPPIRLLSRMLFCSLAFFSPFAHCFELYPLTQGGSGTKFGSSLLKTWKAQLRPWGLAALGATDATRPARRGAGCDQGQKPHELEVLRRFHRTYGPASRVRPGPALPVLRPFGRPSLDRRAAPDAGVADRRD